MTEKNKETLMTFGKVALMFFLGFLAIITGAFIWNAAAVGSASTFYVVVSVLNVIAEGVGMYFLGKKIFKKGEL